MGQAAGAGAPPQSGGMNRSVPYRPSYAMAQAPRFAEGGSTSIEVDFGAMASDSPVYNRTTAERFINADDFGSQEIPGLVSSATFKKSPVFQPLVNPVTGELNQRTGHIPYRPLYKDYSAPGQPAGLRATPQYAQFQMQMPMFNRPSRGGDTRLQRPIPYMTQTYLDKIKADES